MNTSTLNYVEEASADEASSDANRITEEDIARWQRESDYEEVVNIIRSGADVELTEYQMDLYFSDEFINYVVPS